MEKSVKVYFYERGGNMISAKNKNWNVVKMYKEDKQPYIETIIVIRTPLRESEIHDKFKMFPNSITPTLEGVNNNIEEIIGDTFEADVVSIYSGVKNLLN